MCVCLISSAQNYIYGHINNEACSSHLDFNCPKNLACNNE